MPALSMHFRMTADADEVKDRFTLEVESIRQADEEETIRMQQQLYDLLLQHKHEFLAFMKTGSILPPVVRVLPPDTLPRNPRTGKIKQVIDRRHV